eukprot:6368575-Amphidinium_carterae.1
MEQSTHSNPSKNPSIKASERWLGQYWALKARGKPWQGWNWAEEWSSIHGSRELGLPGASVKLPQQKEVAKGRS